MTAEELKELLDEYDYAYHTLDEPIISDEEYDMLKRKYLELVVNGETDVHGGGVSTKLPKVPHLHPILSLDKIHDVGTLKQKMKEFEIGAVQPKLDGLTVVVYGKGSLFIDKAVYSTRGDGINGEDISLTASRIPGLIPVDNIAYRAEAFIPKKEFERINQERIANGEEPFKNARNAAAGMLKSLDPDKVKGLTYYAYNIIGSDKSETSQLELLKVCGIKVVPSRKFVNTETSINSAADWVATFSKQDRENLSYEIDGMVIKSDLENSIELFGVTGHHPKNAVAFKYATESVTSRLTDVVWQLGKHGTLSPVAVFDPVDILGSTVSRATLHNTKYIEALDLHYGDEIEVIKANEIIPKIISCRPSGLAERPPINIPSRCPVCGGILTMDKSAIYCENIMCQGKIIAQVAHMAGKDALNIENLSHKTITKMFDKGFLNSKLDIFKVTVDQIESLDGFARPSAEKLHKAIKDSRNNVPFDRVIYSAGIPCIGRTASKDIANLFMELYDQQGHTHPTTPMTLFFNDIMLNRSQKLLTVPNLGMVMGNAIKDNIGAIKDMYMAMDSVSFNFKKVVKPVGKKLSFVITGALYRGTRDTYKEIIEKYGHKLSGSVSKNTDYLVTNETTQTTKRQKAEELGVKIIDEDELLTLLSTF